MVRAVAVVGHGVEGERLGEWGRLPGESADVGTEDGWELGGCRKVMVHK